MDAEPSDMELNACLMQMKSKKQPGEDGIVAEALQYGEDELKVSVFRVVRDMWNKAASQEPGHEGADWPAEWRVGLMVPLWKKGSRSDKNPWRVGSKLVTGR